MLIKFSLDQIVTPKRAAMLLDRIMVALHHALEDSEDGQGRKINDVYRDAHYYGPKSDKTHGTKEKSSTGKGKSSSHKTSPHDELPDTEEEYMDMRSVEGGQEARENTVI